MKRGKRHSKEGSLTRHCAFGCPWAWGCRGALMCCQQPPGEAQTRCRGSVLRVSEGPCVSRVAAHPKAAMVFGNCSLQPTLPKGDDEDLNGAVPRCALQTWGLASSPCQAVEPLALLIHHNCSQRRCCRISPGRIPLPALRPYSISYLTETSRVHSGAHGVSPASSTWCRPHRGSPVSCYL